VELNHQWTGQLVLQYSIINSSAFFVTEHVGIQTHYWNDWFFPVPAFSGVSLTM